MRKPTRKHQCGHPDEEHNEAEDRTPCQQDGKRREEDGEKIIHAKHMGAVSGYEKGARRQISIVTLGAAD